MPEETDSPFIAYLIPEFPGQTHIFFWREIQAVRKSGARVEIHSTRPPSDRDRARHAFATSAINETRYLLGRSLLPMAGAVLWALFCHPLRLGYLVVLLLSGAADSTVGRLRALRTVPPAALLAFRCARRGVTSLHVHSAADSALIAVGVHCLERIPFSLTVHGDLDYWRGGLELKLTEASRVFFITEAIRSDALSKFKKLSIDKTEICRMGVDADRWVRRTSDTDRRAGGHIGCVARLHRSKGLDDLVRAVAMLAEQGQPTVCHIIGAGQERETLIKLVNDLGVSQRVVLHGSLSEDAIIEILDKCVMFVLPSHREPLGVVYMEAMALELPVIGTSAGGVPELVRHGVDGVLVPPKSPEVLADAIRELLADPLRSATLGRAARKRIESAFDSRVGASVVVEAARNMLTHGQV